MRGRRETRIWGKVEGEVGKQWEVGRVRRHQGLSEGERVWKGEFTIGVCDGELRGLDGARKAYQHGS